MLLHREELREHYVLQAQLPVAMGVAHVKAKDPKDKEKEKEKERERERQLERERAAAQAAKQQLAAQAGIKCALHLIPSFGPFKMLLYTQALSKI